MHPKCSDCIWWKFDSKGTDEFKKNYGECRGGLPQITTNNMDTEIGSWPLTRSDDFCGHYDPKVKEDAFI